MPLQEGRGEDWLGARLLAGQLVTKTRLPPESSSLTWLVIDGPQDLRVVAVTPATLELNWLRPQAEVDRFVVSYVSAGNQRCGWKCPPRQTGLLTGLMPVEYVVTVTAERGRAVSYPASIRANTGTAGQGLGKFLSLGAASLGSRVSGSQAPLNALHRVCGSPKAPAGGPPLYQGL